MSGGSSGSSTTTSSPPSQYLNAYSDAVNKASALSSQSYVPYVGQTVADLSPDQQSAISAVQNLQGIANPYINSAAQEIGQSTSPVVTGDVSGLVGSATGSGITNAANSAMSGVNGAANAGVSGIQGAATGGMGGIYGAAQTLNPGNVNQWLSPYTQDVVNATQAQFNNQNAQQQQQVVGNAVSQGAYGGDRSAVAQGITAGQQQLSEAPTIANLYNQGYSTALGALEQQGAQQLQGATSAGQLGLSGAQSAGQLGLSGAQSAGQYGLQGAENLAGLQLQGAGTLLGGNEAQGWLSSQAGYGLANLGNEALSTGITGANALMSTGNLEQEQQQAELNVPYYQYTAGQAWPYQTAGWYANIAEGLGGASGGTSTTTTSGGNSASSALGAGLTTAGILNQTGAFGNSSNGGSGWLSDLFSSGSSDAGTAVNDFGNWATDAFASVAARGGAIPHRTTGGGVAPMGNSIPDMSASIIPGASGLGVQSSGKGSFDLTNPNLQDVTKTTSGGGGSSALSGLGSLAGIAVAALANRGGRIPERAGGGIIHFPSNLTRMPGTGMRGITANANVASMPHAPRLASGGIAMPQISTPSSGFTYLQSPNGVAIPQLTGTGTGGIAGSSGGLSAVNSYLNSAKSSLPSSAPATTTATPAASTPAVTITASPDSLSSPTLGGGNEAGGGGTGGTDSASEADSSSSFARGGIIGRDDGGDIPMLDDTPSHAFEGTPMPALGGGDQAAPTFDMPDTGSGNGVGPMAAPASSVPTAPSPAPPSDSGGITAMPTNSYSTQAGGQQPPTHPEDQHHSNWGETLMAMGLGIMGGTSSNPWVNIGRGALQGLEYGQKARAQEETANLNRIRSEELAQYRQQTGLQHQQQLGLEQDKFAAQQAQSDRQFNALQDRSDRQYDLEKAKFGLDVDRANKEAYTYQPGTQEDPNDPTKQITGVWKIPKTGDQQPTFIGGMNLTSKASAGTANIPPDTVSMLAERVMSGDSTALQGLGYGSSAAANRMAVNNRVTEILRAQGMTGADLAAKTAEYMGEKAAARTSGTREANVSMAVNEAQKFMPLALQASDAVNRTQYPSINSIIQAYEKGTGDENVVRLAVATNSLVNAYSRAITPSGIPTEGNQQRARELLDKAWTQGQYSSAVDQLWKEMQAAKASPVQTQQEQRERISGRSQQTQAPITSMRYKAVGPNNQVIYSDDQHIWYNPDGTTFRQ